MDCKRILENNVNKVTFNNEINLAIECISKVQKITINDFKEISNEIFNSSINGREQTLCKRKIYQFKKNDMILGSLECYMALDKSFIEIFHH